MRAGNGEWRSERLAVLDVYRQAGCGGTLTLKIERGYVYTATLPAPAFSGGNYTIEGTRVTLNYPYRWQFNRVAPLIAPGANYPATTQINSVAIMQNLN